MANLFQVGGTVVCSITVKDANDVLQDPATSMRIKITMVIPYYEVKVALTAMTDDAGTGVYHYDCDTTGYMKGVYEVEYVAVDGTKTTIERDSFGLE